MLAYQGIMVIIKKNLFRNDQDISFNSSKDDVIFQCIDWNCSDFWKKTDDSDTENNSDNNYKKSKRLFEIRAYGITDQKCSIFVKIVGYHPYLYIKVSDNWSRSHLVRFKEQLKMKVYASLKDSVYQCKLIKRKELYGFQNEKKFKFVEIICENIGCFYSVRNVLEGKWANREKTIEEYGKCHVRLFKIGNEVFDFSESIYESNISPLLRFFHDCNANPAGWLKIKAKKYEIIMDTETRCQFEIKCQSKNVKSYDKKDISPIVIASFDIECSSLDGSFPKPERRYDEIIQIGTTVHKYGEQTCCYKSMVTLKKCNKIKGVDLVCCDNERKLLLEWAKVIKHIDPDVITGYNIWGFDMIYIYKRCVNGCGGVFGDFEKIFNEIYSRNNKHKVKFLEKKLASSALGENFLKYHNCEGIVGIDMFKLIQKDYNLGSYKLDAVSQKFISGNVTKINIKDNSLEITSNNTDGLTAGQHISLDISAKHINKPNVKKKYKISKINGQVFTIEKISIKNLFLNNENGKEMYIKFKELKIKVGWYQNKLDLPPQQIFDNYKIGTPDKIKEIAVYCIKDCELVNFLVMKLAVISNNIGAANVCCVPFSYLFLRGQGIKIFSCFAKECRKEKMMIKVLDRNKMDKDGYEGAIVFTPKPDIYFEPVVVMDYASLYPSSMIAENISHEMLVVVNEYNLEGKLIKSKGESKYLNLPEYNYNEIEYDAFQGIADDKIKIGKKVCIFAEKKDGTKGLIPRVLVKFLKARKDTRSSIKYKTIKTKDDKEFTGLLKEKEVLGITKYYINKVHEEPDIIDKDNVESIKDTYNDFQKAVLDGLQMAYKVVCNSVYGQVGATTSQICCKELAASTTAVGRSMVIKARDYALEKYEGSKLIYGDSVPGDEPLLLRRPDKTITIKTIEELSDEWVQYINFKPFDSNRSEKQKAFVNYEVWAKNKWNPIRKVIRHKTKKKIYRINTHIGCVDVTEDHSLINEKFEKIKPEECIIGETKLSHTFPTEFKEFDCIVPEQGKEEKIDETLYECSKCKEKYKDFYYKTNKNKRCKQCKLCKKRKQCSTQGRNFKNMVKEWLNVYTPFYEIMEDEAKAWGMFMRDGSCGSYVCKSGKKNSWALNNNNLDRLNEYKNILEKVEPIKFKILDSLKSSGAYKLVPVESIVYMVNKYRPLFYDKNKAKLIPDCILNAGFGIRKAFFEGYYDADGSKTGNCGLNKTINFVTKNKITAQCLYYLATSIGYDKLYINIQPKRNADYYWITSCKKWGKNPNILKKMVHLRNTEKEYVYDLETEHGVFACGVGKIQLVNTDSIFVSFKDYLYKKYGRINDKELLQKSIEVGMEAGAYITTKLKKPQDLEYEKTFYPLAIFSKKRYFGNKYEYDNKKYKQTSMGIVLKRRDNAPVVKDIYSGVIDIILNSKNIERAKKYYKERIANLLDGNVDIDDLIVTKSVKATQSYSNPTQIAHKVLADRIGLRDPGNKPRANDRIPYCYIDKKELKCKICNKCINEKDCKCLKCMELYCKYHLHNHRSSCVTICRYYKTTKKQDDSLTMCNVCGGWYNSTAMTRHRIRKDKYGTEHHDKCKKRLPTKLLQGDIIEHPSYISKNNIKIDYRYYLDHQIQKPVMQIFELVMTDPDSITKAIIRQNDNKKMGLQNISKWFKVIRKSDTEKEI